jgi:hypothetical protein
VPQVVDFARDGAPQLGLRVLDIAGEFPLDVLHLLRTQEGRDEPKDHHEVR